MLIELTKENATLKADIDTQSIVVKQYEDLEPRYKAALDLLGEKTEQVEELKQDIEDMREAYKTQIQDLVTKINSFTK
jgi:TATA element modulatory factor